MIINNKVFDDFKKHVDYCVNVRKQELPKLGGFISFTKDRIYLDMCGYRGYSELTTEVPAKHVNKTYNIGSYGAVCLAKALIYRPESVIVRLTHSGLSAKMDYNEKSYIKFAAKRRCEFNEPAWL